MTYRAHFLLSPSLSHYSTGDCIILARLAWEQRAAARSTQEHGTSGRRASTAPVSGNYGRPHMGAECGERDKEERWVGRATYRELPRNP